jgi:hypothetical protein
MTTANLGVLGELESEYPELEWFGESEVTPRRRAIPLSVRRRIERHKLAHDRLMRAVTAMKRHMAVRNGRLAFTLPARTTQEAAAKLGISHDLFSHLHNSVKVRNAHLARRTSAFGRPSAVQTEAELESGSEFEAEDCKGTTKLSTHWWGVQVWLNECDTKKVTSAMSVGSDAADICGKLGKGEASLVCKALNVALKVYKTWIGYVDDGSGVKLNWTWLQLSNPAMWTSPIVTAQ